MRILSLVTSDHARFYRQQVAGLRNRGHEVDVVSVPGRPVEDGVAVGGRSVSTYAKYFPRAVAAARDDYDLVHANYGLVAPAAVVQPFHPVVVSLWGSDLLGEYGWLSRLCSRLADAVVVMSEEMADAVDRDSHVVPHGVDLEKFRPLPQSAARAELGWDPDGCRVLFPYGPSREEKDFPRAERGVERARSRLDGPIELQTMSGVPHDRVPWYMNAADAMVLTSQSEGFPNTVKEAMACNLPVIAADVGDVADHLDDVVHSTAASDDETLARTLAEALRAGERSDGRDAIARYGLENQLDRIESVYESVSREVSAA
jgi:glycosyltransferase involved in cell wall biosynthesis